MTTIIDYVQNMCHTNKCVPSNKHVWRNALLTFNYRDLLKPELDLSWYDLHSYTVIYFDLRVCFR